MFLSGKSISEIGGDIFTPFKSEQVDCCAYTMRVGSEVYISAEDGRASSSPITQLHSKEPITIHAGQFAYLITKEYVRLPFDMVALINIKNGLKVQGLINVSGFHVDPGYDGKLIFAVFNAGPKNIVLREGDDAFLIWLARLEDPSEKFSRKKKGYREITSELASNIPQESVSLSSLNIKLEDLKRKFEYAAMAASIAITIIGTLLVGLSRK